MASADHGAAASSASKEAKSPANLNFTHTAPVRVPPLDGSDMSKIPHILPHERVFPVQIGTELFKLSGASISSDAPSYFSQYFLCQMKKAQETGEDLSTAIRTLYIDRDPETFRDISLHLQGYHVKPRDGQHFVRLFADAQFFSLPRLISQLFEEFIFISIGQREFQIPRDLFSEPGNSPNYFSLGFGMFFSRPEDLFPGLEREHLIRPPSILPPAVPNRSADVFADLVHMLRGYPLEFRDETHRAELLRDCRYFNFKGLEQKLIPHRIAYNQARSRDEISLRLEDLLKSGINVATDAAAPGTDAVPPTVDQQQQHPPQPPPQASAQTPSSWTGWVNYARPYVDDQAAELVLEIGGETTKIHFPGPDDEDGDRRPSPRAEFFNKTRARVARLFEVIATKLNLSTTTQPLGLLMNSGGAGSQPPTPGHTPLSEDLVRVIIDKDAHVVLDGKAWTPPPAVAVASEVASLDDGGLGLDQDMDLMGDLGSSRKRRRVDYHGNGNAAFGSGVSTPGKVGGPAKEWVVRTGQWRLKIYSKGNGHIGGAGGKGSVECVLVAVKLDAYTSEGSRNAARSFLT